MTGCGILVLRVDSSAEAIPPSAAEKEESFDAYSLSCAWLWGACPMSSDRSPPVHVSRGRCVCHIRGLGAGWFIRPRGFLRDQRLHHECRSRLQQPSLSVLQVAMRYRAKRPASIGNVPLQGLHLPEPA